jgi:hypothetical protein
MPAQVKKIVLAIWIFFIPTGSLFSQQKKERDSVRFQKITLTSDFISEGVAVADVNRDGKPDIMAGSFWFEAPDWKRHEITAPRIYFPDTTFSNSFLDFSLDVNQDGWPDLIRISLPGEEMVWYENPGNRPVRWKERLIALHVGNESPAFEDVDGDGRKDILCNDPVAKKVVWFKSPAQPGDTAWKEYVISSSPDLATNRYTHGLGWGDMNDDGRHDLIVTKGWWEHPADPERTEWVFHAGDFGGDCAQIYCADLDQDGDKDLISSSAHDYGIWWHEQNNTAGNFTHHEISRIFSQSHALAFEDINGDGHPDLVTGKRYYAHNGKDPGAHDASVLYWFEFIPGKKPVWTAHRIDDDSGVGLQVLVVDVNLDGRTDILVSNKKGLHLFIQKQ